MAAKTRLYLVYELGKNDTEWLSEVRASSMESAIASASAFYGIPRKKLLVIRKGAN